MFDPDDAAGGSGGSGDDWELMFSPSISSLSSFAPEDYSFPLQQHLSQSNNNNSYRNPTPEPSPPPQPQPTTSPAKRPQQLNHHNNDHQNQTRDHIRQKQRTPPLQHRPTPTPLRKPTHAQISIPVPNLHTPPPTSPRRRPGGILARGASSSATATATAAAAATAGPGMQHDVTTPTNAGPARFGLHMGVGTGMGVGLGAGLPATPLSSGGLQMRLRRGRDGDGDGDGDGVQEQDGLDEGVGQGREEESGSGRGSRGSVSASVSASGSGSSPSRVLNQGLSQSWSEIGLSGDDERADGGGSGAGSGSGAGDADSSSGDDERAQCQRYSWDSVATLRDAAVQGPLPDHDDADDEGDGSRTHVEHAADPHKPAHQGARVRWFDGHVGSRDASRERGPSRGHDRALGKEDRHVRELARTCPGSDSESQRERGSAAVGGSGRGSEGGGAAGDAPEAKKWHEDMAGYGLASRDDGAEEDTLPPGRVMLMERLCDLVQRLSSVRVGGGMEADVIDVLNAKVDDMEDLLVLAEETAEAEATAELEAQAAAEGRAGGAAQPEGIAGDEAQGGGEGREPEGEAREQEKQPDAGPGNGNSSKCTSGRSSAVPTPLLQVGGQEIRDLASPLPWLTSTFKFSELSISPVHGCPELAAATNEALEAAKRDAQAQAEAAERVATEAERLNRELARVIKKLQRRKEESDHLHALLIDRAEAAATRILDLEKETCDLEDDILANESELRHLRLKLRAVETLCYEFVHPDADPVLFESIENWKADWVLVRDRMLERKKGRRERRARLHRAGCVVSALGERENESTLTSLGGLSMSVSLLGVGGSAKKGC